MINNQTFNCVSKFAKTSPGCPCVACVINITILWTRIWSLYVLSIIDWHYWKNINMLHDGRADGKGIEKNVAGDNEKWRKAPCVHHLSYRSATAWQYTSWIMVIWSGFGIVMALAAAGGGDRTLSDASLPFHGNCADRETSQLKHYVGATSSHAICPICPCSPRTYTVLTTLQRTRSASRSRFFGRPPFTTGNKTNLASSVGVQHTVVQCVDTPTITGIC